MVNLPAAFVEDRPRHGTHGYYYQVFDIDGVEVASGRGENLAQAHEVATRLLALLCWDEPSQALRSKEPVPF
jgi:hypothetical protein